MLPRACQLTALEHPCDGARIPAIALYAYADQRSRERAQDAAFNVFVAKPTRSEVLLQLIDRVWTD